VNPIAVDAILREFGIDNMTKLRAADPIMLGRLLGADALIYGQVDSYEGYYFMLMSSGELHEAQESTDEAATLATTHGFPFILVSATSRAGFLLVTQGKHEEGIAQICRMLSLVAETGLRRRGVLFALAEAYLSACRPDEGLAALAEASSITITELPDAEVFFNLKANCSRLRAPPEQPKQKRVVAQRFGLPAATARSRWSCARPPASAGCCVTPVAVTKRTRCSPTSTAGSPRASTLPT
jgi:hypothetical protein